MSNQLVTREVKAQARSFGAPSYDFRNALAAAPHGRGGALAASAAPHIPFGRISFRFYFALIALSPFWDTRRSSFVLPALVRTILLPNHFYHDLWLLNYL